MIREVKFRDERNNYKRYKDLIHGIDALAPSEMMAWQLIRNECHKQGIEVPTLDKIIEIKPTWRQDD